MSAYNFLQFDVFTDRAFCGNPLAVFPEAEGISDEAMGQIAREMNLSETVFVLKHDSEDVLRRLRIFTPTREIPFAGHPIVGTWTALAQEGVVPLPADAGRAGTIHAGGSRGPASRAALLSARSGCPQLGASGTASARHAGGRSGLTCGRSRLSPIAGPRH